MEVFYIVLKTMPTKNNEYYSIIKGAYAYCLVKETKRSNAYRKIEFFCKTLKFYNSKNRNEN